MCFSDLDPAEFFQSEEAIVEFWIEFPPMTHAVISDFRVNP